ncbi:MAG: BON domain-containing protein [Pseudodesulfovibrio sp.]
MHRFATLCMACMLLVGTLLASGCAVYDVAVEERNASDWANDENITFTIKKQFFDDESISYMDFDAASYEGHVYILGEYDSHEQVDRAVAIAKSVEGVGEVTTYLLPKRAQDYCGITDNLDIYRQVKQLLISDDDIWSTNIEVETVQCNVVLLGIVGTHAEKAAAYAHATSVTGVRSVKSFIIVK